MRNGNVNIVFFGLSSIDHLFSDRDRDREGKRETERDNEGERKTIILH